MLANGMPRRATLPLLAACLLFSSSCRSTNDGNSPVAAVATTTAVAVGGALAPVGNALYAVTPHDRRLPYPAVYNLGDGRLAIANPTGWFTDKSDLGPGRDGESAWLIDLQREPRHVDGLIVLSAQNLDRWFFRDHPRAGLRQVLYEGPLKAVNTTTGDRVRMHDNRTTITVLLGNAAHRIKLSQDSPDLPRP